MSKKPCSACGDEKDASEFYAKSAKCKGCYNARQKELKAARAGGKKAKRAGKNGGGSHRKKSGRALAALPAPPADATLSRPAGLGFAAKLEVDASTKQTDIRLDQWNATAGADQSIWLNQSEARELHSWLTEQLGA